MVSSSIGSDARGRMKHGMKPRFGEARGRGGDRGGKFRGHCEAESKGSRRPDPAPLGERPGDGEQTGIDTCGRKRKDEREAHPTGVNVSMPLAAAQGRPFDFATSWTFLAVMSTASAIERERMCPGDGLGDSL